MSGGVLYPLVAEGAHASGVLIGFQPDLAPRTDSGASGSSATNVITDAAILATDVGRLVTGTNIPLGVYVLAVTPGVSFTIGNGGNAVNPTGAVSQVTLGGGYSVTPYENWLPFIETRWHKMFKTVKYTISVVGTIGTAPSSWSLSARVEQLLGHTQGHQYQFGIWAPIQDEQLQAHVAEGVGFYCAGQTPPTAGSAYGVLANSTTGADDGSGVLTSAFTAPAAGSAATVANTARITVARTISQALGQTRVRLQPSITGGDGTTQIMLSATAEGAY